MSYTDEVSYDEEEEGEYDEDEPEEEYEDDDQPQPEENPGSSWETGSEETGFFFCLRSST